MGLSFWLWGTLIAFGGGCLVCILNYALSRMMLRKWPSLYSAFTVIRQVFNIGYLVALYFMAPLTPWNMVHLLLGGALGVTLPMIYFTVKLVRLSDGVNKAEPPGHAVSSIEAEEADHTDETGKVDHTDGTGKADNTDETEVEKHG